ncbi:Ig-like domain-containing protein [Pseudomonas gingeri]|nr:Ig-like domain-containing protein [Pseudomonas gingeri]
MIIPLEPRMLFDGAVAATVAEAAQPASHASTDAAKAPATDHAAAPADAHPQSDATPTPAPAAVPGQSVVFVDSRVQDFDSLLKGVAPGTQVVVLQAGKDGLQQIADYLDTHQGVSTVEIIAHGNSGDLWLGSTYLSSDNVAARADVLARIGNDMNVGGDILIYACNTAEGATGIGFVDSLAQYTGRDIAASTNRTGLGGDWTLEISTGTIESHNVLSADAMAAYQFGLATLTVTNSGDTGAGTLRQALSDAVTGDIVTFSSSMTVNLNSQLVITKNLTVEGDLNHDGVADVTISGQYKTQVLQVNSGVTATLDGLIITKGLAVGNGAAAGTDGTAAMGGGIVNAGNLTLNNVTVTSNAASGGGGGGGVTAPYVGGTVGGGGGGGGALGGQTGGHGGNAGFGTGVYAGLAGGANTGGNGGGYATNYMGGKGATVAIGGSTGGAGATGGSNYSNGGNGGTASNGTISIGGGGGGSGWDHAGAAGASASGGIYNASTGTLTIVGTSVISNNIAAGGGGGGGGGLGSGSSGSGGAAGKGVGAIWNKGTLLMTAANFAAMSGNVGGSGSGGPALGGGSTGAVPAAVNNIFNDGGTLNTAYAPPPTATIVVTTTAQHIGSTSLVTFTFNQAVTGFTNADLTVSNGTLSAVSSSDGGTTWTATFTPSASVTSATNHIVLDNTGVSSASTSTAGTGTTTSNNYAVDTVRPTASIVVSNAALNIGGTSLVTITFSEAVSSFSLADMTASNGTLSNLATSDNIHWTATLTPTASNNSSGNVITLDNTLYTDTATNAGTGTTTSNTYAVDTVRPTASIVVSNAALNIGGTSLVTITFSEAVTGFTNADLTVADGTLSAVSSSDGGITWTATLTPTAGVTHTGDVISLDNTGVSDAASNTGSGTTNSNSYAVDTQRPTATIVFGSTNLGIGQTSQVTITFSEAVTGFTNADLTVSNGTLSAVSSSDGGVTWTATFTPTAAAVSASNHITLTNSDVQDAAGNAGSGTTTSNNYSVDGVRPTATVVVSNNNLGIGGTSVVTITFSEAVTGFTNADLTVANGTLSAVSSSDGGITWTATFTPTSNITDATNVITLDNSGYTDTSGNAGTGTTNSNNYAIDTQRPTASIVVSNTALNIGGNTSLVTITFSETVNDLTLGAFTVADGALSNLVQVDGTHWTATLTATGGVTHTGDVITLNNTAFSDGASNAGVGTTNSNTYAVDTVQPIATIVFSNPIMGIGQTSLVTFTFNEAVTGFSNADLTVANGSLSAVSSSDGGVTWTATFTPTAAVVSASNHITLTNSDVQDAAGNAGSGTTTSNNYSVDGVRPTATVVVSNNNLGIGGTSVVTITFTEAVSGLTLADLTTDNGALSGLSTSDNITYTALLTPTAGITQSNNHIVLDNSTVVDGAGNSGTGTTSSNAYSLDSMRPTATIVMGSPTLLVGQSSLVTITFSEAVTGFDNLDLSVPNGTLSAVSSSDGGVTWTATFTPTSNVLDTTNLITLNNTDVADLAGNAGVGVTNSGNFTIDTVRPTASISLSDSALKIGDTSLVTITFSEAVTGFSNADLTVANGILSAVSSSDGGITWTATFTPTNNIADATNVITLHNTGVQNASGNAGAGTTDSGNYTVDTQRPTASVVVANSGLNIGGTSLVTITFSEAVTGFTNADLTLTDGTLSNVSSSDGGITWTATLTPNAGTTHTGNVITLDNTGVSDLAGNAGAGSTLSNTYNVDTVAPTATVAIDHSALNIGQTAVVTITFSEAVNNFSNADLTVANGTLSAVSSSDGGITWTGTFTPTSNISHASNVISLNNTTYTDLAGNAGTGTTDSGNYAIDTQRPTASIVVADSALNIGQTSLVTITFSEAVTGFSNADLTVANGTLSAVSSSDGGITWTATFTPTSNIAHASNVISLDNTTYIDLAGNAGTGTTDSNSYAIDTQRPTATISVTNNNLGIGQTTTVTIAFSEVVTGFNLSELSVANGTLSNLASADGGKTWTATLTPTAAITDATNLIVLDTSLVSDTAGNAGASIAISNNYALDADRPTATISVANPNLTAGQSTVVTFTFSEKVSNFDLSELSVANGTLSNLVSSDGGKTWTATLTPSANVTDPSNFITLDNSLVTDLAGNAGTGFANSNNFAVNTVALGGDPQFRVTVPVATSQAPNVPLLAQISVLPTGNLGAPLGFPPLFEQRTSGDGLPPVGNIFINQNALAPSYIAQVFSTDSANAGTTSGFLGFGGGDGGVFGGSTLSTLFNHASGNSDTSSSQVFDRNGKGLGDPAQGARGIFGAPTLGQQLQKIKDTEQKQLHELAWALEQVGISEMSA